MHVYYYYYYYCNSWTNQTHYGLLYLTKNPTPKKPTMRFCGTLSQMANNPKRAEQIPDYHSNQINFT